MLSLPEVKHIVGTIIHFGKKILIIKKFEGV